MQASLKLTLSVVPSRTSYSCLTESHTFISQSFRIRMFSGTPVIRVPLQSPRRENEQ
jgi:hypothetical protein